MTAVGESNGRTKSEKHEILEVDDFLEKIGQFGRKQIIMVALFCLIIIPSTYQTLVMSFVGNSPAWRCAKNATGCNMTGVFSKGDAQFKKRCYMKRDQWEFVKDEQFSIVTEWDLVCEKNIHSHLANSALFIGWAVGAIILGYVSDRYGRKVVLFPSWAMVLIGGFASAFVHHFWLFFCLRLAIGICQGGVSLALFILATELVGPKYRAFSGTMLWFAFTFALCIMGLQAWLLPTWRTIMIITSIPYIILLASYKFIPESVRWLRLNNKIEEAETILKGVAKTNKKEWPNAHLSKPVMSTNDRKASFKDVFVPCSMCISSLVQAFAWFVNGQVYYGISLASDNLGGDQYRDFVLTSLVEIPGNVLVIVCSNKFGRKRTVISSMILGGLACIGIAFIPINDEPVYMWSRVALGMLGKLCITVSFNSLYIWSVELYPTIIRSQGMGLQIVVSRVGAASAPWIAQFLGHFNKILPFIVMGTLPLVSAFMLCVLKETKGQATAETLDDVKKEIESVEEIQMKGSPNEGLDHKF